MTTTTNATPARVIRRLAAMPRVTAETLTAEIIDLALQHAWAAKPNPGADPGIRSTLTEALDRLLRRGDVGVIDDDGVVARAVSVVNTLIRTAIRSLGRRATE
jgi:hypothetical protein